MNNILQKFRFFLILVLFGTACTNPFTTREPEEPVSGRQSWIQPREPEQVLENLRNAFLEQNTENYIRSLSDTSRGQPPFTFIPEPTIAAENPGVFEAWSKDNERFYFNALREIVPADSLHLLSFQNAQSSFIADSALVIVNYILRLHNYHQSQGVPVQTRGEARLTMFADTFGDWAISRWEDRAVGDEPTWSVYKARYGN